MTVLERIKQLCREKKNISITTLEQELGYSNGSLAKAKDIPSSRIMEIAEYLEVTMDYLMIGKNGNALLFETAKQDAALSLINDQVKEYALRLDKLSEDKRNLIFNMIEQLEK